MESKWENTQAQPGSDFDVWRYIGIRKEQTPAGTHPGQVVS